jgi:hypothetical protein
MVWFDALVEILIGAVAHFTAENVTNSTRIGSMFVGGDAIWLTPNASDRMFEKCFGGRQIACLTEYRIDQVTVAVNRPVQILPFAFHFNVGFVHVPRFPSLVTPFGA